MKIQKVDEIISLKRSVENGTEEQFVQVKSIIETVKKLGDEAVRSYTERFDRVLLQSFLIRQSEIDEAYELVGKEMIAVIQEAAANIKAYHLKQLHPSWMMTEENGTILGQKITPLDSVGVYVPGGTAAYPSSVLMNVIPAKVGGRC